MLITRYLSKNLLAVMVFVTIALTTVIWLTQSLKLLELVANSDAPPILFLKLVVLSLPKFLEIILPISLVIAILFTYNKFIADNELIIMRASGFDQLMLARPALYIALATTILLLALTTYISPKSYSELLVLRQTVKSQFSSFLLREGVFNTFSDDLTVYLRRRDAQGDLYGLMIHDTRDKTKPPVTVTAKKGQMAMDGEIPTIIVYDGMRQQMDERNKSVSKLYFSKYTIEIKSLENESATRWHGPRERTVWELFNPDLTNRKDRDNAPVFRVEAHHRLVTPFNAIAFSLIALTSVLLGPFNRRGQSRKILMAAILVIAFQSLNFTMLSLMKDNPDLTVLLYLLTFGPIAVCGYLLNMRGEQALMALLRKWNQRDMKGGIA